jgi:O-methyltransferase
MFEGIILSNWMVPFLKPDFHRVASRAKRYSMVSRKRMQNIWRLIHRIERDGVKGNFLELGVARGGTAILIATLAQHSKLLREVWLCDAFEDFSPPEFYFKDVARLLFEEEKFDLRRVHLVKGMFDRAIPTYPGGPISFIHIDAGYYEPVRQCLEPLLPLVEKGGYVVFDNYGVDEGCRKAVQESLHRSGAALKLTRFGRTQAFMQRL